ncbi:unnamed protein product [Paramecium primaurelia]|uniref:Uncharacterized protein n=1 Tax=Paramecium primaurelia TaxID=5886 RepID=A0A8S1K8M8_PARPR|nr:unnamed protein product [Paramecium primaurelia]
MKKIILQPPSKQYQFQQNQLKQHNKNPQNFIEEKKIFELQGKLAYYDPYKYSQFFGIVQVQIEYSKNGIQTIIYNGQILRKQKIYGTDNQHQNIEHLEQIQYLSWEGNYGKNNQKIGKWIAFWKGERLLAGGNYDEFEYKIGQWVELDQNFCEFIFIFINLYQLLSSFPFRKLQKWKKISQLVVDYMMRMNKEMEVGLIYISISMSFQLFSIQSWNQITYSGVYINDKKQGLWNTIFQREIIGGGQYDENGLKNDKWTDIDDQICDMYNNVIYVGEYANGIKKGNWITIKNGNIIGGGNFDVYGMKNGKWIDVINNFNQRNNITEAGSYLNGIRVGQWNYVYRGQIIGGGSYNDEGFKNGEWIQLYDNSKRYIDVLCKGVYQNGIKSGKWITINKGEKIGEEQYNENGLKIGNWIELDQQFREYKQVIYVGKYLNGKKHGQWDIMRFGNIIGGGQYNDDGLKIGKWQDLDDSFCNIKQVTYVGEYQNGVKYGKWETICFKIIIGQGEYNYIGQKIGKWIDLDDHYHKQEFILINSLVQNRQIKQEYIKMGKNMGNGKLIIKDKSCGGQYDFDWAKKGKWIEPIQNFYSQKEILFEGIYNQGQKFGKWKSYKKSQTLGGGLYNEQGLKHGKWIDLDDDYQSFRQITYSGEYFNGKQKGNWYILYKEDLIGGGSYNEQGLKDGKRIEIQDNFQKFCQLTYAGEFQNGKKKGRWFILYQGNAFGGGHYNQLGLKNGEWIEADDSFFDWNMKIQFITYHQGIKQNQQLISRL